MFVVLVVSAVPDHLRGYLTRFVSEVSVGVFVGNLSPRVADAIWERCLAARKEGACTLVYPNKNRLQGFGLRVAGDPSRVVHDISDLWLASLPDSPENVKNGTRAD